MMWHGLPADDPNPLEEVAGKDVMSWTFLDHWQDANATS
jgi:hypothetical protein